MLSCSYHISWPANLFHFVNNLSEWHFSCRRHYNDFWLRETGPLAGAESEALQTAATVLRRHGYSERHPGTPFVLAPTGDEAWAQVMALIGAEDGGLLRQAFAALAERFDRIWAADHISLEALETDDPGRVAAVVIHEVCHLMERPRFDPLFREVSQRYGLTERRGANGWDAHHLIKEAFTHALCPEGILRSHLGLPSADLVAEAEQLRRLNNHRVAGIKELTMRYMPLVAAYVEAGRPVDEALLEEAYRIFEATPGLLAQVSQ